MGVLLRLVFICFPLELKFRVHNIQGGGCSPLDRKFAHNLRRAMCEVYVVRLHIITKTQGKAIEIQKKLSIKNSKSSANVFP